MTWFNQLLATPFAWLSQHAALGWWTIGLSLVATVGGLLLMRWFVLWIPHDYFVRPHAIGWKAQHPLARWILLVGKNLAGAVLLVLGLTMLVTPPGDRDAAGGPVAVGCARQAPLGKADHRHSLGIADDQSIAQTEPNRPALELPTEK